MEHSIQVFICHALEETVLDDAGIVDQDLAPAESNSSAEKLFAAFSIAHIQLQGEHLVISVKYTQVYIFVGMRDRVAQWSNLNNRGLYADYKKDPSRHREVTKQTGNT